MYLYSCIIVFKYYCILVYLFNCILVCLFTCMQGIGVASILVYLILGVYSAMHLSSINLCHLCRLFSRTESGFQKNLGTFNSKGITCVWVPVNHICCHLVYLFVCWSYQIFWHAWILISSFWRNDCTKERPDLGVTCLLTIQKITDVTSCRKALEPAPEGITRCRRAPELSWLLDAAGLGTLFLHWSATSYIFTLNI